MYGMVRLEDTIRIPPNKFSEDLNEVVTKIVLLAILNDCEKSVILFFNHIDISLAIKMVA